MLAIQTIIPADVLVDTKQQVDTKQLDGYFTRLRRGIKCYWKGTCSKEDKETVQNSATLLIIFLAIVLKIAYEKPWIKEPTIQELHDLTKKYSDR